MGQCAGRRHVFVLQGLACLVLAVATCWAQARAPLSVSDEPSLAVLPLDLGAAGADWVLKGEASTVQDERLGVEVIEVAAGETLELGTPVSFSGAYVVEALVRFPDARGKATLYCGVPAGGDASSAACSLDVACSGTWGFVARTYVSPEAAAGIESGPPRARSGVVSTRERFPPDQVSPVWPETFRKEVEAGLAKLPRNEELWRALRIEVLPESVRMYQNGYLVADERQLGAISGRALLSLRGPARVASLEARRIDQAQGPYVPALLDHVCNAAGAVAASSLPEAGREVMIDGIPFVLPHRMNGTDHVDVGQSLFRYRMGGYHEATRTWPSPAQLDPARIMLRVPKAAYRRLWVLAGSDGEPLHTPVMTVRFFRAHRGWPLDCVARVPEFTARTAPADARRIPVRLLDGTRANLWLIPVDVDAFWLSSDFREELVLNIELTKEVKDWRASPDPAAYGSFQAGLPSGVRLYGLTLEKAPVSVIASGDSDGNLYMEPEEPVWVVNLASQCAQDRSATVTLDVTDPRGGHSAHRAIAAVPAGGTARLTFRLHAGACGLHTVRTTVECDGYVQSREGTFLTVPANTRQADAKTSRWGLWCWGGGHNTNPSIEQNLRLLWTLGCRLGAPGSYEQRRKWGLGPTVSLILWGMAPFTAEDPYDPAKYAEFSEKMGAQVAEALQKTPDLQYVAIFAEHSVSMRLTQAPPPYAFGEPWFDYTDAERRTIRQHILTAKAAFEGIKKHAPGVKCLFGWCAPLFATAHMREPDFPAELVDGFGLDSPSSTRRRTASAWGTRSWYTPSLTSPPAIRLRSDTARTPTASCAPPSCPWRMARTGSRSAGPCTTAKTTGEPSITGA